MLEQAGVKLARSTEAEIDAGSQLHHPEDVSDGNRSRTLEIDALDSYLGTFIEFKDDPQAFIGFFGAGIDASEGVPQLQE